LNWKWNKAHCATAEKSPSAQTVRLSDAPIRQELQRFGHIRSRYAPVQLLNDFSVFSCIVFKLLYYSPRIKHHKKRNINRVKKTDVSRPDYSIELTWDWDSGGTSAYFPCLLL